MVDILEMRVRTCANYGWKDDFSEKLREFAVRIIRLKSTTAWTPAEFLSAFKFIRTSTSVGDSFFAAQDAPSYRKNN